MHSPTFRTHSCPSRVRYPAALGVSGARCPHAWRRHAPQLHALTQFLQLPPRLLQLRPLRRWLEIGGGRGLSPPPSFSPRTFDSLPVAPLLLATLSCSLHALSNQGCARASHCSPFALLPQHSAVVRTVIPTKERAPSRNDQAGAALQQAACGSPPVSSKACACCTQRLIRRWHASHRAATKPHVRRCRSCRRTGDSCCTSDSTVSMSLRTIWACAPGVQAQSEAGSRSLMCDIYVSLSTTWACASGCQAQKIRRAPQSLW